MAVIELPDEQAAVLAAKAAVEGLSLQDWLGQLAHQSSNTRTETGQFCSQDDQLDSRPISEVIADIMSDVPAEELAQLPADGASQVDHYVYGTPKRY